MVDLTILGGTIFDGTGRPGFEADLMIDGGRIVLVGDASEIEGTRTWDATGKVVSPGFIDIHSHADFPLYVDGLAQSGIRQGITASVTGNCGHGPAPAPDKELAKQVTIGVNDDWGIGFDWTTFEEYLDALFAKGQSMNVAPLVPHGTVRIAAMGYDARPATGKELDTMRSLVDEAMAAGAVGMSSGLEYSPGRYADEAELIALAEVVGRHGGIYSTHMRERGDNFEQAVQEALNI
ncbi:MAG: amidohydrolase family protein, partial [Chloroflexi bacterium]|nr:amidohydrolase family protein [Chloroflexota bacterium]